MSDAVAVRADGTESPALSQEKLAELYKQSRAALKSALAAPKPDRLAAFRTVCELGLEKYAAQLEVDGYTVIPPELVATPDFVGRVADTLLRVAEERTGVPHALDQAGNPGRYMNPGTSGDSYILFYLLFEDEVFEEWMENPVLAAMIDFMMPGQAQLSSLTSFVRWCNPHIEEELTLGLHSDFPETPETLVPIGYNLVCNAALVLSEYTKENGALAVVPGSHRLGRYPLLGEGVDRAVPVECPTGSLILWQGGTWHGAYRRTTPGIRLNLTSFHCHRALKTQERYREAVPAEMLARRSPRFARLMGIDDPMGWTTNGPDIPGVRY